MKCWSRANNGGCGVKLVQNRSVGRFGKIHGHIRMVELSKATNPIFFKKKIDDFAIPIRKAIRDKS
jgi:hypothetical protein